MRGRGNDEVSWISIISATYQSSSHATRQMRWYSDPLKMIKIPSLSRTIDMTPHIFSYHLDRKNYVSLVASRRGVIR